MKKTINRRHGKVLVTGGAGFIGSHLADKLIEKGYQVIIIDNLSAGKKENINPKAKFYKLNICNFKKIEPLFKDIDFVFHLAAMPRVPFSVKEPVKTSENNILGTINVFKASHDHNVKRIVFASSSSVYGNQKKLPLKETAETKPLSPYALQKSVGEQFAKLFNELYKIQIVCLRFFNVYGPRIDFDSEYSLVLGRFLKQKRNREPLTIFGTGEQTRSFSFVDDVVEANIKAMKSKKIKGFEIINIGSKQSYSINYLAEIIGGPKKYLPIRKGDPLHTKADITRAKKLLNWKPKTPFDKGIKKTEKWFINKYQYYKNSC